MHATVPGSARGYRHRHRHRYLFTRSRPVLPTWLPRSRERTAAARTRTASPGLARTAQSFVQRTTAKHMNRPNVLYAVSHDLRIDFSSDALTAITESRGARFTNAFSQAPYCAPSRNSFFTGRRPSVTRVHTFDKHDARTYAPIAPARGEHRAAWTALPHAFADSNYSTFGVGITVDGDYRSDSRCPGCWTEGYYKEWPRDVELSTFDAIVANASIAWLVQWHLRPERPFFLMTGFHGGHKPWPLEAELHAAYGADGYTLVRMASTPRSPPRQPPCTCAAPRACVNEGEPGAARLRQRCPLALHERPTHQRASSRCCCRMRSHLSHCACFACVHTCVRAPLAVP